VKIKQISLLVPALCLWLTGCAGPFISALNQTNATLVGAAAIDVPNGNASLDPSLYKTNGNEYAGILLSTSATNCLQFMNRLSVAERGIDTGFDISSTVLSSLATAFTPLATVHALSAASAISTGTKTAIDSDIYVKETAPLIIQELNVTYWTDYYTEQKRIQDLGATTQVDPYIELSFVQGLNRECSLDYAIANLSKTSAAASVKQAPITKNQLSQGNVITSPVNGIQYQITEAAAPGSSTITVESKPSGATSFSDPESYNEDDFLAFINPAS